MTVTDSSSVQADFCPEVPSFEIVTPENPKQPLGGKKTSGNAEASKLHFLYWLVSSLPRAKEWLLTAWKVGLLYWEFTRRCVLPSTCPLSEQWALPSQKAHLCLNGALDTGTNTPSESPLARVTSVEVSFPHLLGAGFDVGHGNHREVPVPVPVGIYGHLPGDTCRRTRTRR